MPAFDDAPARWEHQSLTQRVRFASGDALGALGDELARLGATRLMVIATETHAELAGRITAGLPVAVHHREVAMHVPIELAERARNVAADEAVDVIVTVGGGSTTGLGKAIALTSGLPIVAVPTTYAGSEATNVWGLTEGGAKTTGVDGRVLPKVVVYDATLTISLPVEVSVASGLNALAHCVDAMWGPRVDPIDRALAADGIRALSVGLPQIVGDPSGLSGREHALYAAYVSAVAFASAGSGLHHKICHVLGGMFDLPHAQTHAVVLPYVLAFNGPAAPDAERRIAAALNGETTSRSQSSSAGQTASHSDSALEGLQRLRLGLKAPGALRDFGFTEAGITAAAEAILPEVPANNPRPVTVENLGRLLHAALDGADPVVFRAEEVSR